MIDSSRLANVLFDSGKQLREDEYRELCEAIREDRFSLDSNLLAYKKSENILGGSYFRLSDYSNIVLNEEALSILHSLDLDKERLSDYMQMDKANFKQVVREIFNGIEQISD